jgi:menaquinone-dependent protoporphyrinogen oxidase
MCRMKTLIAYESRHGCAAKCAGSLRKLLGGNAVDVINLDEPLRPGLPNYQQLIVGGSVHAGKLGKKMRKFLKKHANELGRLKLGFYLCHLEEEKATFGVLCSGLDDEIINQADAIGFFGGELDYERMNVFEKAVVKKLSGVKSNTSTVNEENIRKFAEQFDIQ